MSLCEKAIAEQNIIRGGDSYIIEVWDWVRSQIDFKKFRERSIEALNNPTTSVKVVLMEYSSVWRNGDVLTEFFVPKTNISTICLKSDLKVIDYLNEQISNRNSTVELYTRPKIVYGMPHDYRRQLVVKFNCIKDIPSPIEALDEDL